MRAVGLSTVSHYLFSEANYLFSASSRVTELEDCPGRENLPLVVRRLASWLMECLEMALLRKWSASRGASVAAELAEYGGGGSPMTGAHGWWPPPPPRPFTRP